MLQRLPALLRSLLLVLLAAGACAQAIGPRKGPALPGGENAGGTGVWILPAAAAFSSPNYSYGPVYIKDAEDNVVLAPGYAWVRVDDAIAYFYEGAFVGADLGFFVESASGGVTVDAGLNDLGDWHRTG